MTRQQLLPLLLAIACHVEAAPPTSQTLAQNPPAAQANTNPQTQSTTKPSVNRPTIVDAPLPNQEKRRLLGIQYLQKHNNPEANTTTITPRMIIQHWTAGSSAKGTIATFSSATIENARTDVKKGGELNVSSHFLVDRDGTIYQLLPETELARHCIGLNHVAIGVENVGGIKGFPLTQAQINANEALVRYLVDKYPEITHLIGHLEYRSFEEHPYFVELDKTYRNQKPDPGPDFMKQLRKQLADLPLLGPPETDKPKNK